MLIEHVPTCVVCVVFAHLKNIIVFIIIICALDNLQFLVLIFRTKI